jgi:hypothetical protein
MNNIDSTVNERLTQIEKLESKKAFITRNISIISLNSNQ